MPETKMDEKQAQQPAASAPSAGKADTALLVTRALVLLLGLAWAGTVAFLLSQIKFLGSASVPFGFARLSGAGLAAGVAAGAAIVFFVLKRLGGQLAWARPGLGRAVRLFSFIFIGGLVGFGSYALYMAPSISSVWWTAIAGPWTLMGKSVSVKPILFPAVAVFLTVMGAVYLALNREKATDFLIETEGEIKKVSWPARKEYMGSAAIVVLVVAIVSMFLHYVDLGLSKLMQAWGVGF